MLAGYRSATQEGLRQNAAQLLSKVSTGEVIATLEGRPLRASLSGHLRGLTHSGVRVEAGTKVIEVNPHDPGAQVLGIGERPRRIAAGVVAALTVRPIVWSMPNAPERGPGFSPPQPSAADWR
jgi:xanthine dehydrogenase accessory factor